MVKPIFATFAAFAFKIVVVSAVWLAPALASAQAPSGGPMIIERIHSGFVIAPDVKATEIDHKVSPLLGVYGGWLADETLLVGAGGYWLTNDHHDDREMAYGGFVVQWLGNRGGRFGFGVKGLLGGGEATMTQSFTIQIPAVRAPNGQITMPAITRTERATLRRSFALAEPEILGVVRLAKQLRLTGGVGYRFAGSDDHRDPFGGDLRLSGATGSVALQIGGGS